MRLRGLFVWKVISMILALCSVFFFPFWVQAICIALLLFTVRPAILALIPALTADLLYSGSESFWKHFSVTGIVSVGLILFWILKTKTRIFYTYDVVEKEK